MPQTGAGQGAGPPREARVQRGPLDPGPLSSSLGPRPAGRRQDVLFPVHNSAMAQSAEALREGERLLPYHFVRSRRDSDRKDIGKEKKKKRLDAETFHLNGTRVHVLSNKTTTQAAHF